MTKPATRRVGSDGEDAAVAALVAAGYEVVERNVHSRMGESDVICRHDGTRVFVEIKTRRSHHVGYPQEHVTVLKQRRIGRLAAAYLQRNAAKESACRFDFVSVRLDPGGEPRVEIIAGAFRLS
ncbi:MAG: YraN family protein [Armatimonadetes bacterium]|nr:YraN family protein [Armatimonadota bacterium]